MAGLLAVVMTVTALPNQALAYMVDKASGLTLTDINGNQITTDDSWEERFPYGTFAFQNSQLIVTEGGEPGVIQVYRLGGTIGKAIAYIQYVPAVGRIGEEKYSYANAAGYGDVLIQVEDPLPITAYQAIGRDPAPSVPVPAVGVTVEAEPGGDGYVLSANVDADAYQWYVLNGGSWEEITGAEDRDLVMDAEYYGDYDYYCVYTQDGIRYGSDSAKGLPYMPEEEEVLAKVPADLELNPEPSYSTLEMDPSAPYDGYVFSMVFADGEWVKEIRVSVPNDEIAEADKFGTFTIIDCDGASLYDAANTMALHIVDDEAPGESALGFEVTKAEFDKSAGTAELTVRRTGGTQSVVSVDYATEDGTAKPGRDYNAVSGTLLFYSDVDEQTIEIPLIDDGVASEDRSSFLVRLSNVRGGGNELCALIEGKDSAEVFLYNTATMEEPNLATLLYDSEAVDISGNVTEAKGSVAPVNTGAVTGKALVEDVEEVTAQIGHGSSGIMPLTYSYGTPVTFGSTTANDSYWHDYLTIVNGAGYNTNALGFSASWSNSDGTFEQYGAGVRLRHDNAATATLNIPNMATYYSSINAKFEYQAKAANRWTQMWYGREYVFPWDAIQTRSGANFIYQSCNVKESGNWGNGYGTLAYDSTGTLSTNWGMSSNVSCLVLGLSRHDSRGSSGDAWVAVTNAVLQRRTFTNNLNLRIYTANDEDTAPAYGARLTESSGVYDSMRPVVSIVSKQGGANSRGQLYVGSQLRIDLASTDTYFKATGSSGADINYAVYLTNKSGNVVARATGSGTTYYMTLGFPTTEAALSDQYTLNIVMTRRQELVLDVTPSADRSRELNATAAWGRFNESTDGTGKGIEAGYSPVGAAAPHFTKSGGELKTDTLTAGGDTAFTYSWLDRENVQWINFHRSPEDRIVFNGRTYLGNDQIWLTMADLANKKIQFLYYHKDFLTSESIMTPTIDRMALYLDANGNGRIDGYFNEETGYFVLDENTTDQFIMFLEDGVDYDESIFAPVKINGKYCQYFLKVFYTKIPRSLIAPEGKQNNKAQVLPAFISSVTNSGVYASLTAEQKSYRYIIAGQNRTFENKAKGDAADENAGYSFSSDDLIMYGGEATRMAVLDVPLGGDISPAAVNGSGNGYTWMPDYQGNLLYPFSNPEPIFIEHSLAGDNIPIAQISGYDQDAGAFTYQGNGAQKLNGYLGSFVGSSTVAICVQVQKQSVPEIAAANGISSGWAGILPGSGAALQTTAGSEDAADKSTAVRPAPEAVNVGKNGTFPNSEYLKENEGSGQAPLSDVDMSGSGNKYSEFNLDMGLELPSTEIESVNGYVTIIMDGYEVGFALGLPLTGYEAGEGKKSFKDANTEDMGKLKDFLSGKKAADIDDTLGNAKKGGGLKSKQFSVDFGMSMAILFKYNPLDNTYYFSQFAVAISAGLEFTVQGRLTPCPIVYLYVTVGIEIEVGTGATVERISETEATNLAAGWGSLTTGSSKTFQTKYKAFDIQFKGRLLVELLDGKGDPAKGFTMGYISSDGDKTVSVTMVQQSGMKLDTEYTVRLTALEDTVISSVKRVNDVRTVSYWSGIRIAPEVYMEAGAGIGVELLKFEVFIKISIACAMTLGAYNMAESKYDAFSFDEFEFALGLGFRVVLLFFSYEMDLIGYKVSYNGEKWTQGWSAFNGALGGESDIYAVDASGNTYGVRVRLPGSTAGTQKIYSNESSGIATIAFNATDEGVPFQLSGYGSSGDAFKLADGLTLGYDYRVIQAGGENYVVYTISRGSGDARHPVDYTMLVMSRLRLTRDTRGDDVYGMVNPVDSENATPYILLDTVGGGDDGTGDLDFDVWVKNGAIYAAWVSYDSTTDTRPEPGRPAIGAARPTADDGTVMDEANYNTSPFGKIGVPSAPEKPGEEPEAPGEAPDPEDYYEIIDREAFEELSEEEQRKYTPLDGEDTDAAWYGRAADGSVYEDYNAAKAAYDGAMVEYGKRKDEYDTWKTVKEAYQKYLDELQKYYSYMEWYNYFAALNDYNAWAQSVQEGAARKTVVKEASFTPGTDASFANAKVISGGTGAFVFLPNVVDEGVVVYGKSVHFEDNELNKKINEYGSYLNTLYSDSDFDNEDAIKASGQIRDYRMLYQKGMWHTYGKASALCVSVGGETRAEIQLGSGQILENIEAAKAGGSLYVAYTTGEQAKDGSGIPVNIRRLYLRKLDLNASTPNGKFGEALLLRTLYDYDDSNDKDGMYVGGTLKTGYTDPYFANLQFLTGKLGGITGTDESFSVQTMSADGGAETFLLFEMNGSTYVIPEASLESITGGTHSGQIIPFFKPEEVNGGTPTSTGRAEVTIGADGAGNIAAVYVGAVPNTTNNAIFMTKWDPVSSSWGAGIMLAMNHMQVYEDAQVNGWSAEETEAAYLGELEGYQNGGMDQFLFSNLQIALGQNKDGENRIEGGIGGGEDQAGSGASSIYAGWTGGLPVVVLPGQTPGGTEDGTGGNTGGGTDGNTGGGKDIVPTEMEPFTSNRDTLLVLTQGSMTKLAYQTNGTERFLVPDSGEGSSMGIYAISYGVGNQAVGNVKLSFDTYNFTAGSELVAGVSFTNVGDVGIRASMDNPATVKLMLYTPDTPDTMDVTGGTHELRTWNLTENVRSGQEVRLETAVCSPLTMDLPNGSVFYILVEEDREYIEGSGGTVFRADTLGRDQDGNMTGDLVVRPKAELALEDVSIAAVSADAAAGTTTLQVEFTAINRGNKRAEDVFVQFRYETTLTENGEEKIVYRPLDISDNTLNVSAAQRIQTLSVRSVAWEALGVLHLSSGSGDDGALPENMQRTIKGTITVPSSAYQGAVTGSLNLHLEIFSGEENINTFATETYAAEHDEYNSANNVVTRQIEHKTFFAAADKITLPLGATLRLPVSSASSATGKINNISVEEILNEEDPEKKLGVLYYENTEANSGMIVINPVKTGDGIVHLKDEATNTLLAITFEVTEPGSGIDIYKDNGIFTFFNSTGEKYDGTAAVASQDWRFDDGILNWGSSGEAVPMRNNLSKGAENSYFTFTTMSESIDLYFEGEARISSNFPGFSTLTVTGAGGDAFTSIYLGSNPNNVAYTVTVKVTGTAPGSEYAWFDRLEEHYAEDEAPIPSADDGAPEFLWSRSFPQANSLKTGSGAVSLTCYVLDDSTLANLTVNGEPPSDAYLTKKSDGFWEVKLEVSENGSYTVAAQDGSGNRSVYILNVDWFTDDEPTGDSGALGLEGRFVDGDGKELDLKNSGYLSKDTEVYLVADVDGEEYVEISVTRRFQVDNGTEKRLDKGAPLTPEEDERFLIEANGWYVLRVENEDGIWSQVVLLMDRIDGEKPLAKLSEDGTYSLSPDKDWFLIWIAYKENPTLSPIRSVSINGFELNEDYGFGAASTSVGGTFPIRYSGEYTIVAEDETGNQNTREPFTVSNDHLLDLSGLVLDVTNSWNQDADNGSMTVNLDSITGGLYDESRSNPETNEYVGSYELCLVPAGQIDETRGEAEWLKALLTKGTEWKTWNTGDEPDADEAGENEITGEATSEDGITEDKTSGDKTDADATYTYENLAPGDYRIYIRDALDPYNTDVVNYYDFTVGNEAISVDAKTTNASSDDAENGTLTVTASGGRGGEGIYQFAFLPLKGNGSSLTDITSLSGEWLYGDQNGSSPSKLFTDLRSGWYQVAVRAMENVTKEDIGELTGLHYEMITAQERYDEAVEATGASGVAARVEELAYDIQFALSMWNETIANLADQDGNEDMLTAEQQAKEAYEALVGNNEDVLEALRVWRAAQEDVAALGEISGETTEMTEEQKARVSAANAAGDAYDHALREYLTKKAGDEANTALEKAEETKDFAKSAYDAWKAALEEKAEQAFEENADLWDNAFTGKIYISYNSTPSDSDEGYGDGYSGGYSGGSHNNTSSSTSVRIVYSGSGSVNVSNLNARSGEQVVITASPSDGYIVGSVTVTDRKGNPVSVTDSGDGTYSFTMPAASPVTVSVTFVPKTLASDPRDPHVNGVADLLIVDDHIAFMQGYDGKFRPELGITRAEAAQVFYNLLQDKNVAGASAFSDVGEGAWYYEAVAALTGLGVLNGYEDNTFRPGQSITRAEFVTIAMHLANAVDDTSGQFSDVPYGHWAHDYISGSVFYGWITGYGDGTFRPGRDITRAEAVTVVNHMLLRTADEKYVGQNIDSLNLFPDVSPDSWYFYGVMEAANTHEHTFEAGRETWGT